MPANFAAKRRRMANDKLKYFVFNDETEENSYGFFVLTAGIELKRFDKNPICLKDHTNTTKCVLGKWADYKAEGTVLGGYFKPDTQDNEGVEVVRKVENDTLKGCSMGIMFNPKDLKMIDGKLVLNKCILFEVSIVAVPSNANSIALYNPSGKLLTEAEVKQLCLSAQQSENIEKPENNMKIILAHLQLADTATELEALKAIKDTEANLAAVTTERDALKTKIAELENKEAERLKVEFTTELDAKVLDGTLSADIKQSALELYAKAPEEAKTFLSKLPKRKTVAEQLNNPEATETPEQKYDKLSWSELDKGNYLAAIKLNMPEYYEQRFEKQFGKKPNKQ